MYVFLLSYYYKWYLSVYMQRLLLNPFFVKEMFNLRRPELVAVWKITSGILKKKNCAWYSEYIYVKKPYLTVIVLNRGWSQNMCPIKPFCMKYIEENATFRTKFRFKMKRTREKLIFLWTSSLFQKEKRGGGSLLKYLNRYYLKL